MRRLGIKNAASAWAGWSLALAAGASGAASPADPADGWARCQRDTNPERCLATLETEALQAPHARKAPWAIRQGALLRLQAPGASEIRLEDSAQSHYRALGPVGRSGTWLVARLSPADSPALLLVNAASGQSLGLDAPPRPAPDGHLLVAIRPGQPDHDGSTLTLLQRSGNRWSVVFRYEAPAGLHLNFHRWRSDGAAVHLQWQRSATPTCPTGDGSAQLRDGPFGWDFVPEMPPPCQAAEAHSSS
ncbi:hypothetical protein [Ideonella oryzae]|uniref:Uncharacterized protein n=1 Tax=Ideonella oryzae TaxID=2937441 RepID=A0ABT1BL31_9BURK|nr:hypothetical protein [Ideonella oryzae]MCO5976920.1 hypothetical protein [Ideonella oryzae]